MKPTYVLYHGFPCADGFGAAFAAWCALGDTAEYLPVNYHQAMPSLPDGARVFIVDFSYPDNARAREELCALSERCELVVIDHHKTAAEALAGLPFVIFDDTKSGAVLAWEYFRTLEEPDAMHMGEVPALLRYIQDRDLWQWQLPRSREVSAGLVLEDRRFSRWLQLVEMSGRGIDHLALAGEIVLRTQGVLIDAICAQAHERTLVAGVEGEDTQLADVLAVNTPVLQSECCHELLQRHPERNVVAAFYNKDWLTRVWSLRSRAGVDCSHIAKANGGGGHAQACGFTEDLA